MTQVTGFLSDNLTWVGLAQGLALLAALWWAWVGYSWLTNNAVRAEEATPARLVVLAAMAAMLVASLAAPDAFGKAGIIFGAAYFVVRFLHLTLYGFTAGDSAEARRAVIGFAPGALGDRRCCSSPRPSRSTTAWRSCAASGASACTPDTSWNATA
jgi:low temperature requirement protein LtrA